MTPECRRSGYRAGAFIALCILLPLTAGCSSISDFMADAMPQWAGGMPADAPPRPSDPRYEEYERALQAKVEGPAKAVPAPPLAQAAK
jgi:hypothetical protein